MLTGDGGIIGKASDAKLETEKSDIEEQINTIVIRNSGDYTMDKDKLLGDFEEELPDGKEIEDSGDLIYIIYPDYSFEVDLETGKVTPTEVEKVEDETPWELAGSGTEAEPYLIESIEDLVAFSNSVNEGNHYEDKYVKLTRTLDFNSSLSYDNPNTKVSEKTNRIIKEDSNGTVIKEFLTSGTGFNPIGNGRERFKGSFNGDGNDIKNIYINRAEEDYVALFGDSQNGEINSINLTGSVVGNRYVAGVSGIATQIKQCSNSAYVSGTEDVGGISGTAKSVKYCVNKGEINLKGATGGGVVGTADEVSYSYNRGNVIEELEMSNTGGISGWSGESDTVNNCYNAGELVETLGTSGTYTGGIVGSNRGTILNCYNLSKVKNNRDASGIADGQGGAYTSVIKNSYNAGSVSRSGIWSGTLCDLVEISECYYLAGTAKGGINGNDIEGKAMPLSESEMPSVMEVVSEGAEQVEYNGQMVDVWKEDTNNINNGYPILYWQ